MSYYRRADTRGFVDLGWLQSRHSFSFGSWYDPPIWASLFYG